MVQRKQKLTVAAILSVAVMQMGVNGISPILADLAEEFPEASASTIQFLMTFPCLFVIVAGLISGTMAQRVGKKPMIVAGTSLFVLSGMMALVLHGSLTILFVWSAVMGIGIGLAVPVNMAQVIDLIDQRDQANVMGMASSVANLGCMAMILVGGYLALIHWSCNYLVYLIALPAVILAVTVLPAGRQTVQKEEAQGGMLTLLQVPQIVIVLGIAFTSTILFNVIPTNLSMRIAELELGNSAQAGVGTALMLLSGGISCMFYGRLSRKLGNYVLTLGFGLMCLGQLVCAFAPNIAMIYLGCIICGASHGNNMAHCLLIGGRHAGNRASLCTSMTSAVGNTGAFCTPALTVVAAWLAGNSLTAPRLMLSGACAGAVALAIGIINYYRNSLRKTGGLQA